MQLEYIVRIPANADEHRQFCQSSTWDARDKEAVSISARPAQTDNELYGTSQVVFVYFWL